MLINSMMHSKRAKGMHIKELIAKYMPDSWYLKYVYKKVIGKDLNLKHPVSFNEKLQWLKLHDRNPVYTQYVDKYRVREHIAKLLGEEYLIPLVGGPWEKFEDIDISNLPNKFVLKCTHDSGSVILCTDKNKFEMEKASNILKKALQRNFFYENREWPYKNVKPAIIAEKFMVDDKEAELVDYKLHCFNGKVKFILVCANRDEHENMQKVFYDTNWKKMDLKRPNSRADRDMPKPLNFEKMIEIAEMLSDKIPFLRVDLYEISGKLYFGELTFYPASGFEGFEPLEWDKKIGEWLDLQKNNR